MRQQIEFYLFSSYFTRNYWPRSKYQTRMHRYNDWEHSGTVIIALITVFEILHSVKYFYLPNGSTRHTECVIKRNIRILGSSRFKEESIYTISDASQIYY